MDLKEDEDIGSYVLNIENNTDKDYGTIVSSSMLVTGITGFVLYGVEGAFYGTLASYCIAEVFRKMNGIYRRKKAVEEEPLLLVVDPSGEKPLYEVQEGMLEILPEDYPHRKEIEISIAREYTKLEKLKKKIPLI